jgi:hypothetical protein
MRRLLIVQAVMVGMAACASQSHWPDLAPDASRAVVAVGYFEHTRYLDERPCMMTDEEIASGVVDCFATAPPFQAAFVVQQVVFGTFHTRRVQVAVHTTHGIEELPLGRARPQIVLFVSDGWHHIPPRLRPASSQQTSGGTGRGVAGIGSDDSGLEGAIGSGRMGTRQRRSLRVIQNRPSGT